MSETRLIDLLPSPLVSAAFVGRTFPHVTDDAVILHELGALCFTDLAWNKDTGGTHNQISRQYIKETDTIMLRCSDNSTPYLKLFSVTWGKSGAPRSLRQWRGKYLVYAFGDTFFRPAPYNAVPSPHTTLGQHTTPTKPVYAIRRLVREDQRTP